MRRLEVFCKVVELKSFTKAADALLLSQPTVSEHIRTLEESLGEKMVDRLGREVIATPAGAIFYPYARNIIQLREEAMQALAKFKGDLAGHLAVGASTIPGTYILPGLVGSFKGRHPDVEITLVIGDTAEIVEHLLEGKIEAGVIGSKWNHRSLLLAEMFSDELVLVVYPGHPWASKNKISFKDLESEGFILRERGSGTRMVMTRILEEHGFACSRLRVVARMGSTEAVRQAIKARVGVSILSRNAVAEDLKLGTLASVDIPGVNFLRPLYLVQRKNRQLSPLASAFLDHMREGNAGHVQEKD